MTKSRNFLKSFAVCFLILLQAAYSSCDDIAPSVVKIYSNYKYHCAGTLVKGNFVVTSAGCLWHRKPEELIVMGNVEFTQLNATEISSVTDIFKPQDYDEKVRYMDVAVLKLKKSIAGLTVKPAELCKPKDINAGQSVTVYAHDVKDLYGVSIRQTIDLRPYNLQATNKDLCGNRYNEKYNDKMFCAYNPKKIECFADRGGPGVINGEFCAIYNYGLTCLDEIAPGSFTSIADPNVLNFINESLSK